MTATPILDHLLAEAGLEWLADEDPADPGSSDDPSPVP